MAGEAGEVCNAVKKLRYVRRRCRAASIQDIAAELHLEWHMVKELEGFDLHADVWVSAKQGRSRRRRAQDRLVRRDGHARRPDGGAASPRAPPAHGRARPANRAR